MDLQEKVPMTLFVAEEIQSPRRSGITAVDKP